MNIGTMLRFSILFTVCLPAAALDRAPEDVLGAGNLSCAQFRKTIDEYKGVTRREQADVVKILQASIQYANFEGTLGGYLARAQMERGVGATPIASTDDAMEEMYRYCAATPTARYIDAVAHYVESLAALKPGIRAPMAPQAAVAPQGAVTPQTAQAPVAAKGPQASASPSAAPAIAAGTVPPGSPVPVQLDAAARKTWEVVKCEAGYSNMYCTLRNIGPDAATGRNFASKSLTADGIAVDTRPVIFYETVRPGQTARAEFGLGAGTYKAVMMQITGK